MRISLICPVYDTPPELLRVAVQSALSQSADTAGGEGIAQLILVDDASPSTATTAALSELAETDHRILLLRSPCNAGPAAARNLGLNVAIGDWIGFLDADDIWLPGHLDRLRNTLAQHPDAGWIGAGHLLLHEGAGTEKPPRMPKDAGAELGPGLHLFAGPTLTRLLLGSFWMHLGGMVMRRDLMRRAGGFAEGLTYGEDMLLMARLSILSPLHMLDAYGYGWRRGRPSLTSNARRLRSGSLRMHDIAARDPLLRGFRRDLRWARYSAVKALAMNNLLAGRRAAALGLAARALMLDPREIAEFTLFLRFLARGTQGPELRRYSMAEQFTVRATT
jgi:glycosyltransferase involved in cell wall biosynthesis